MAKTLKILVLGYFRVKKTKKYDCDEKTWFNRELTDKKYQLRGPGQMR